jgi:8-oxo-dGTP pyrophosphatase MutT (NUDIX family)
MSNYTDIFTHGLGVADQQDEMVARVDMDNRVIGAVRRGDRTYDTIYRVASLWVTNSLDEVLLAQRKHTKAHSPGLWGPAAAGTVGAGETYEENIYREAEEEIGLTGVKFQLGPLTFVDHPGKYRYFRQFFTCELDWPLRKFRLQEAEVEAIAWVERVQLERELTDSPEKFTLSAKEWKKQFLQSSPT